MPQYAEIITTKDPNIFELVAPYNSKFVTDLKFMLQPASTRRWNTETKRWEIAKEHLNLVRNIAASYYETVNERMV